jgi:hypothetical protein
VAFSFPSQLKEDFHVHANFALTPGRLNKYKGAILAHAVPKEVLGKTGRQVPLPKNNSDTYVGRRWLPYGGTLTDQNSINRFFQNGTGDRGNAIVQAHLTAEGVTPTPDSIVPQDIQVVIQQYSCLYGFTDKTYNLYEDDIPTAMVAQIGERVTFVNELILYGALKACTNQFYGGTGTSRATVNGAISLGMVRKIVKNLQANHAKPVNSMLKARRTSAPTRWRWATRSTRTPTSSRTSATCLASPRWRSTPAAAACPTRWARPSASAGSPPGPAGAAGRGRGDRRHQPVVHLGHQPGRLPVHRGGAGRVQPDRGARQGVALDPTFLPPGQKSKSDPLGQRGYAGTVWWKAVMLENQGWMAVGNVGTKVLQ